VTGCAILLEQSDGRYSYSIRGSNMAIPLNSGYKLGNIIRCGVLLIFNKNIIFYLIILKVIHPLFYNFLL